MNIGGAKRERADEASEAAARKIKVLIDLFTAKIIRFSDYESRYGRDFRSFQRDLHHLRKIGKEAGFSISPIAQRERAELIAFEQKVRSLDASPTARALLGALSRSLGAPVERELGAITGEPADAGFLRLIVPKLVNTSHNGRTYDALKSAWEAKPSPAMVEFEYASKGQRSLRRVEPYRILLRSGRDYLLAFDVDRKGWRTFALDNICSTPVKCGSILRLRTIPPEYDTSDVIGFFKSPGDLLQVTVAMTSTVAASIVSRQWQAGQIVELTDDGGALLTFEVSDVAEVVRWALGLGKEARIVAPAAAVSLAISMIEEIAQVYRC